ncbi:site-specific integrase [Clostridium sp.]|uniref:tyrosine-type recombinase/integrase n=1 Tax=Clostridium sp. TaxID=1506 RepID=UPI0026193A4F|nr:site-specific integrase [Clostridium sp.]
MAIKTNYEINGNKYYRVSGVFGRDSKGKLIRKYFYGKNKKEAEQKLEEYKFSLLSGVTQNNLYFSETMKTWLFEFIRSNIKPSCFDRYECTFRNHLENSPFCSKKIKDITGIEIQRYYNELFKNGKTSPTLKRINKLLKRFFTYCVSEGFILRNPCANIVIPCEKKSTKNEVEVFTKEELIKILNFDYKHSIKCIALTSLATGLRQGEVLGLMWKDINFETMEISVERTVSCYAEIDGDKRTLVRKVQSPKTKNSIRTIPLPKSLLPILDKVKKEQLKNRVKLGNYYKSENIGFVFLTADGNIYHKSSVNRSWAIYLKNCGVSHKKFHTLRHNYATLQFENDVPLKTVSNLLGHSSINITADTYTHVLKKEKEKATDIINVLNMC